MGGGLECGQHLAARFRDGGRRAALPAAGRGLLPGAHGLAELAVPAAGAVLPARRALAGAPPPLGRAGAAGRLAATAVAVSIRHTLRERALHPARAARAGGAGRAGLRLGLCVGGGQTTNDERRRTKDEER